MPFRAGCSGHAADRHDRVAVLVMWQIPHRGEPGGITAGGPGERGDVIGRRRVRQRCKFGRVLPGKLAAEGVGMRSGPHQPCVPADRCLVQVLVEVIGHAAQMPGQLERAPFRARRLRAPGHLVELDRELADGLEAGLVSN
jgi:hypothetical protein